MAKSNKPKQEAGGTWVYPQTEDVLEECGLFSIEEYVRRRRHMIVAYVVDQPLLAACREGERQRGTPFCQWWWEQDIELDEQPLTSAASYDSSHSSGALDNVGG